MKKHLIALVCFSFLSTLNAQDSESYKSLDWSVGGHLQTPSSFRYLWNMGNKGATNLFLLQTYPSQRERYPYYENISYYEALQVRLRRRGHLDDYPSAAR